MDTLTDRLRVQDPFPYGHFVENELNVFLNLKASSFNLFLPFSEWI